MLAAIPKEIVDFIVTIIIGYFIFLISLYLYTKLFKKLPIYYNNEKKDFRFNNWKSFILFFLINLLLIGLYVIIIIIYI